MNTDLQKNKWKLSKPNKMNKPIPSMNINPRTKQAYRLLHEGTLAFARAEQAGIHVNMDYIAKEKTRLSKKIESLEQEFKHTKFYQHWKHSRQHEPNIGSNPQLAHFLYNVKKITPAKYTRNEQGATDEEGLTQLNLPELDNLLQIRKLKKVRDTYLESFEREAVNNRIHPSFNLNIARTFRSSSSNPNFQNIPKRDEESMQSCRGALFPRPGHQLLDVDYSGLEVRIAACYHKDPVMLRYINNPASDMHRDMAQQIFSIAKYDDAVHDELRQAAKNGFVFPQFYGSYYKSCAHNLACKWGELPQGKWEAGQGLELGEMTLSEHLISKGIREFGREYVDAKTGRRKATGFLSHVKNIEDDFWNNRFKEYQKWKDRWWEGYKRHGYIDMFTGFRCSGVMERNDCINYPVQGTAFHCLLWSFNRLDQIMRHERWDTKLIGQIHDDIVLDVSPSELNRVAKVVKQVTCEDLTRAWSWINVPLDVKMELCPVDGSWAEKKNFTI